MQLFSQPGQFAQPRGVMPSVQPIQNFQPILTPKPVPQDLRKTPPTSSPSFSTSSHDDPSQLIPLNPPPSLPKPAPLFPQKIQAPSPQNSPSKALDFGAIFQQQGTNLLRNLGPAVLREFGPPLVRRVGPPLARRIGPPLAQKVGLPLAKKVGIPLAKRVCLPIVKKLGGLVLTRIGF